MPSPSGTPVGRVRPSGPVKVFTRTYTSTRNCRKVFTMSPAKSPPIHPGSHSIVDMSMTAYWTIRARLLRVSADSSTGADTAQPVCRSCGRVQRCCRFCSGARPCSPHRLDRHADRGDDSQREQQAQPRLVLEGAAALKPAEQEGVTGPDRRGERGRHGEAPLRIADQATGQRDGRAPAGDEAQPMIMRAPKRCSDCSAQARLRAPRSLGEYPPPAAGPSRRPIR